MMVTPVPPIPHNARTAGVLGESLRILESSPPYNRKLSPGDNWRRACQESDQCVKLLIREVKILDHELFVLRERLGIEYDQSEDAIVTRAIADLDPEH